MVIDNDNNEGFTCRDIALPSLRNIILSDARQCPYLSSCVCAYDVRCTSGVEDCCGGCQSTTGLALGLTFGLLGMVGLGIAVWFHRRVIIRLAFSFCIGPLVNNTGPRDVEMTDMRSPPAFPPPRPPPPSLPPSAPPIEKQSRPEDYETVTTTKTVVKTESFGSCDNE